MAARVLAALRAEADRSALVRRLAAEWAWRDNARCEAARRGIRFSAFSVACARVREVAPFRRRAAVRLPVLRRGELREEALRRGELREAALRRRGLPRLADLRAVDLRAVDLRAGDLPALDLRAPGFRLGEARLAELRRRVEALRVDLPVDLRGLRADFPDDLRFGFSPMSTPARRASESPIAMACFAFFAPCWPSRIWSISRRTNSPACVLADLPSRLSCFARSMVSLSGMWVTPGAFKDPRPCNQRAEQ